MKKARLFSVVLAAGMSSRFGSPKQLAMLDGQSLVQRSVSLATASTGNRSIVVLGAAWPEVLDELTPFDGFVVRNEEFAHGIGSSLACGIRALAGVADAVIVLLADQPSVTPQHIRNLARAWQDDQSCIVASRYAGVDGVPAIFPSRFFPDLLALDGDRGARDVIRANESSLTVVAFENAAVDIDTRADLEKAY